MKAKAPAKQGVTVLLTTDGKETPVTPANGKRFTLKEGQKLVGGYVERLRLSRSIWMLVDEDGFSKGLAPNVRASVMSGHDIVGPALVYTSGQF